MPQPSGNRCGHDPRQPILAAAVPIPKGRGGFPRILSLAAERAKTWYFHPKKCPPLQGHSSRQTRSERREACQIVLETILRHLDLASMCLGTPTLANSFIDIDMRTIVHDSGISQRRCERAIALLKQAGFMRVQQPRRQNDEGAYFGCRAIRVVTETFFEWLGLGPMLQRERARASERLRRKAQKANRKLADFIPRPSPGREQRTLDWNRSWSALVLEGMEPSEAQRRTNEALGYLPGTAQVRNTADDERQCGAHGKPLRGFFAFLRFRAA